MRSKLHISGDLALPTDAQTSTMVIYGGKGMGKTNLGSVLAEELAHARLRFSIIDPMGVWWGLQHGADRRRPGIECLLLGGVHGDIPIEPTAGSVIADLVADEPVSTVIDISRHANGKMWSIGERIRFVADFCTRIYERQGERRVPLHLIVDEAARFAPQEMRHGEADVARCYGALAVIVEEGRNVGIGVTLITQRSARMAKAVSDLGDAMIAFRTVGPKSIGAIIDWLGEHIDKDRWKAMIEQIRKLPRGHALVVSPGWLEFEGIVQMRKRETFDSSATPAPGRELRAPGKATKPDLAKYRERMIATIEKAKADDPRELRKQIEKFGQELRAAQRELERARKAPAPDPKIAASLAESERRLKAKTTWANGLIDSARKAAELLAESAKSHDRACALVREIAVQNSPMTITIHGQPRARDAAIDLGRAAASALTESRNKTGADSTITQSGTPGAGIGGGERKVLIAVAQHTGQGGATREQLSVFTDLKRSSRNTYISRLLGAALIEISGDRILATSAGIAALGSDFEPLPTGAALRAYWFERLPEPERRLLNPIIEAYPESILRDALDAFGLKRSSRNTYLSRLATRHLITVPSAGLVRASDTLF